MPSEVETVGVAEPAALLDVNDVARLLKCSRRHVWRLADYGAMPAKLKLRGLVRFSRAAVEKWIADGCPNMRKAVGR
jgi:excisionase family DNA binding protein